MKSPGSAIFAVPFEAMRFCPNCGAALRTRRGDPLTCETCQAQYGVLFKPSPSPACANCGNPIEGESHKSRVYAGPICESCFDLEKP